MINSTSPRAIVASLSILVLNFVCAGQSSVSCDSDVFELNGLEVNDFVNNGFSCTKYESVVAGSPETKNCTLYDMYYMHIPKCGSSFATIIAQCACPGVHIQPISEVHVFQASSKRQLCTPGALNFFQSSHHPLPALKTQEELDDFFKRNNAVTTIRQPQKRIISGFLHEFHDCSRMGAHGYVYRDVIESGVFHAALEAYFHCVKGCSAKMLLGRRCGDPETLTVADVLHAVQILKRFSFVGVTEQWNLTVDAWKKNFHGSYSSAVYVNTRPATLHHLQSNTSTPYEELKVKLASIMEQEGLFDYADEVLYKVGSEQLLALSNG